MTTEPDDIIELIKNAHTTKPETQAFTPEQAKALNEQINELFAQLDPRLAEILKVRFGLDRGEPRTRTEVAEHFQLTIERVTQLEDQAMTQLRTLRDTPKNL